MGYNVTNTKNEKNIWNFWISPFFGSFGNHC